MGADGKVHELKGEEEDEKERSGMTASTKKMRMKTGGLLYYPSHCNKLARISSITVQK